MPPYIVVWSQCLPAVNATDNKSFDFVIYETFAKLFLTFPKDIIKECRTASGISLIVDNYNTHTTDFLVRNCLLENHLCRVFASNVELEIKALHTK